MYLHEDNLHALKNVNQRSSCVSGGTVVLEIASLFRNNAWIMGCTGPPKLPTHSLPVFRPWDQDNAATLLSVPGVVSHCWNKASRVTYVKGYPSNRHWRPIGL
jgi:hypothetical protein